MYKYIISISAFIVFLIVTLINLEERISLNLIFFNTPEMPGIIFFYLGVALGAIITIPVMVHHAKQSSSKVLNQHMKNESKRLKKQGKKSDTSSTVKGNINSTPTQDNEVQLETDAHTDSDTKHKL